VGREDEFRRRAEQALARAAKAQTPHEREAYEKIARAYLDLIAAEARSQRR
jgi:hypothetical protein